MSDVSSRAELAVQRLRTEPSTQSTLVHLETVQGTGAQWGDVPSCLHSYTQHLLRARGRSRLYVHQSKAITLAHAGQDVLVTTPTASGKSLCYQIPMLDRLLRDPQATAIYIAPTKALARDQWAELQRQVSLLPADAPLRPHHVVAYDGDVPMKERGALQAGARLLVTNPDMIHFSILPRHRQDWWAFLPYLAFVVVDEIHTFRGLFGSHVGNVFRRLNRIHATVGKGNVQYIGASATLANERQLARQLFNRDVAVVNESGAPTADRYIAFLNPPQQKGVMRTRVIAGYEQIFRETGLQSLLFCRTRNVMEWVVDALRENAVAHGLHPSQAQVHIQGYRGGYGAAERRQVEADLQAGKSRTVATTNALEMGIDVGSVGCVVSMGYPGTVASTWQQWGRAGRASDGRDNSALAVFLASRDPLDQFVAQNPGFLLDRGVESAHINPEHPVLLTKHLPCALSEASGMHVAKPDHATPERGRLLWRVMQNLIQEGKVDVSGSGSKTRFHFVGNRKDLRFSLRDIGGTTRILLRDGQGKTEQLGTVENREADAVVHKDAVYFHQGKRYRVVKVDRKKREVFLAPDRSRTYTEAVKHSSVSELQVKEMTRYQFAEVAHGMVGVNSRVIGYRKYDLAQETTTPIPMVELPDSQPSIYDTSAYWLDIEPKVSKSLTGLDLWHPSQSMDGLGNLLLRLAPLHLMCDPGDLGVHVENGVAGITRHRIYIHETFSDGLGLGETLYRKHLDLLQQALEAVANCVCSRGCPACVGPQPYSQDPENAPNRKSLAESLLDMLCYAQ